MCKREDRENIQIDKNRLLRIGSKGDEVRYFRRGGIVERNRTIHIDRKWKWKWIENIDPIVVVDFGVDDNVGIVSDPRGRH